MNRELYNIYNDMFNESFTIIEKIKDSLNKKGAKVYNVEVYVGNESTKEYNLYIEYKLNNSYNNIRGLYNIEKINKMFKIK